MKLNPAFGALLIFACVAGRLSAGPDDILFKAKSRPGQLAISADGKILAASLNNGNILFWSIPEQKILREIVEARAYGRALAFSPNQEILAAISFKSVRIWDVSTGEEKGRLHGIKVENVGHS